MPLINIDVIKGRSEMELRTVRDTVHESMLKHSASPTDRSTPLARGRSTAPACGLHNQACGVISESIRNAASTQERGRAAPSA